MAPDSSSPQRVASPNFSEWELTLLGALADRYPTARAAIGEVAALQASLGLPKPVVHVISDIHGDDKKLRHVINNASGSLRPLVESLFSARLGPEELRNFIAVLYYPRETMEFLSPSFTTREARQQWALETLQRQFEIVRRLAGSYRRQRVLDTFPPEFRELFQEFLDGSCIDRRPAYLETMVEVLSRENQELDAVRAASHVVRNLSVGEILAAGDMGDRGRRIDRVIGYLQRQPHVTITWGNHDTSWMAACLGHEASIATVLRLSLRYRRLSQLEEGYGIITSPVEKLARDVYGDDPCEVFATKGHGLRDDLTMARMQKAAAILQFKLEGQVSGRHPEWNLEHRNLLHRINHDAGTVEVDGKTYPLLDVHFPTINPEDPYSLSEDEQRCIERLRQSFLNSRLLWEQMLFMETHGSMWQRRDDVLIFHACVPVDEDGEYLPLQVDGKEYRGRELFEAIQSVVHRAFREGPRARIEDCDLLWYLWFGERSPLFGKDKMATFEDYFITDKSTHEETKNPYFNLIHDRDFCKRILREFGVSEEGLIVNGHVPVKIEKGEQPLKRGGNAVTIDGAFSEAYGDHGYTLILAPDGIRLAEHHHFESVEDAIVAGEDIIPKVMPLRVYDPARRVADTEDGEALRMRIRMLERLMAAYREASLREAASPDAQENFRG